MMDSQKIAAAAPDRSPWAMVVSDLMAAVNALVAGTRTRTRAVLVGMFLGLPLLISGCAQHKEGSTVLPCELLTKAKVPVALQLGRIVVSVKLNGQPVRMLVDTGANTSTIAPHIAESIGGTYNREKLVHINGVGGRSDAQRPYKVKTIQMGPLHWFDFEVMVVNIAREPKRNDPEAVVGIIGNDLLRWYDLELDFQRGEMTVYQVLNCKGDFIPWEKPYQILRSPVNRERFFIVPVELNGRPLRAVVDTGARATLVARAAALSAGADPAMLQQGQKKTVGGVVGPEAPAHSYRFDTLEIAGKRLRNTPLFVTEASLPDGIDMLLGMDFWSQHKVWVSYRSGQIFMQQIRRRAETMPPASPSPSTSQPERKSYE